MQGSETYQIFPRDPMGTHRQSVHKFYFAKKESGKPASAGCSKPRFSFESSHSIPLLFILHLNFDRKGASPPHMLVKLVFHEEFLFVVDVYNRWSRPREVAERHCYAASKSYRDLSLCDSVNRKFVISGTTYSLLTLCRIVFQVSLASILCFLWV